MAQAAPGVKQLHDLTGRVALGYMAREGFDIRGAAVFMARDAASHITDENFVVDSGLFCFK